MRDHYSYVFATFQHNLKLAAIEGLVTNGLSPTVQADIEFKQAQTRTIPT